MPLEFTGGTSTPCSAWDNNVTILNDALVDANIVTNGLISLTKVDGSSFTNNIPYFPNFVVSGLNLAVSNILGFPNLVYTPGTYQIDAQVYTIGLGSNIILSPGHPTLPRVDIVYVTPLSTVVYLTGTPALNPVQPSVPAGSLLIGVLGVSINATTVAGYTLTSVNFNNIAPAPVPVIPGTLYGNTLYWNSFQWAETQDFHRVVTSYLVDAYQYQTYDATGVTTLAKLGESPSLGERGFEFQVNNLPDFRGSLIFATEADPTPAFTQFILDQEDTVGQYRNILDIDPTINYSKIDSATTNEYTEVYQDFNTIEIANYDIALAAFNSQIKLLPTSITNSVNDLATGDLSNLVQTAYSAYTQVQDPAGSYSLIFTEFDSARLESTDSTLNFTSSISVEDTLIRQRCRDIAGQLESSILFNPAVLSLTSSNATQTGNIQLTPTTTTINSGLCISVRPVAVNTLITVADYMLIATANNITLTLPAAPANGQSYRIKITAATTNALPVVINGNGINIDGAATISVGNGGQYTSIDLVYNTSVNIWLRV